LEWESGRILIDALAFGFVDLQLTIDPHPHGSVDLGGQFVIVGKARHQASGIAHATALGKGDIRRALAIPGRTDRAFEPRYPALLELLIGEVFDEYLGRAIELFLPLDLAVGELGGGGLGEGRLQNFTKLN